jgi:hypothetical protein
MRTWNEEEWIYTHDDIEAYHDSKRVNSHFSLPMPYAERVFSIRITDDGLVTRDPLSPPRFSSKGARVIGGDFGNLVAYKHIKSLHPQAWIWAERYTFTQSPASALWTMSQERFVAALGMEQLIEIQKRAISLDLDPAGKTSGRPDLAVYMPEANMPWRFIELKKKGKDRLSETQRKWLALIADLLGKDAAVEVSLSKFDFSLQFSEE